MHLYFKVLGPEWTPWALIADCNGSCIDFGYKTESRQCLHRNCTGNVTYFPMGQNETRSVECNINDYNCTGKLLFLYCFQ